jgi:acetate kinase
MRTRMGSIVRQSATGSGRVSKGAAEELVLTVNSGSSSLKFGLYAEHDGEERAKLEGGADGIGTSSGRLMIKDAAGKSVLDEKYTLDSPTEALQEIVQALSQFAVAPAAVGHRVVHGGPKLRQHQRITPKLLETLQASVHFAPLHIPPAVELIREAERLLPKARQFACFDTTFHATMPEASYRYALPQELFDMGVQRYGFHGLSYESVVWRLKKDKAGIPARVVCAHLGSGASLAALRDGESIDTSMGMTPTGGVPMATRVGDLDPGIAVFLMRSEGMDAGALETLVNRRSGWAALADGETDMRQLEEKSTAGEEDAKLAIEIFTSAVRKFIGAYAAELGGLDLLVFTGGIGEHSAHIREKICEGLEFLGIGKNGSDKVRVMASEEELQIARHCRRLMRGDKG